MSRMIMKNNIIMPSGKTHDIITAISTPIVGLVTHSLTSDIRTSIILTSSYVLASLMFNGDLDIMSRPFRRWYLLKFIWIPYQNIFEHRSIWTHGIVIGTIVRILYLSPLLLLITNIFNFSWGSVNWNVMIMILIGLEMGNSIHTISDKFVSSI